MKKKLFVILLLSFALVVLVSCEDSSQDVETGDDEFVAPSSLEYIFNEA